MERDNIELVRKLCSIADEAFRSDASLGRRYPNSPAGRGAGSSGLISLVRDRRGHDRRYAINSGKLERELGYRALTSNARGLRDTFDRYIQNERWWHDVINGSYRQWIERQYPVT